MHAIVIDQTDTPNEWTLTTEKPAGRESIRLFKGRVYATDATPTDLGLDPGDLVDLAEVAQGLRRLGDRVDALYIGRSELISAVIHAFAAGEHCFVFGPPGTAKGGVLGAIAEGIGGDFWRILLNPDTERPELVGAYDPAAVAKGEWRRRLCGLATCEVAFIDEVWKGTGQVNNMILDALNERLVKDGENDLRIPLLTAVGASNEVPMDKETQAAYDRWLVRVGVDYLTQADDIRALIKAKAETAEITQEVTTSGIRLLAAAAEFLALDPPEDLIEAAVVLMSEVLASGRIVSNRRLKATIKLAVASALIHGESPQPKHLNVARWTFWSDPDEEMDIRQIVLAATDPAAGKVLDLEALLQALKPSTIDLGALSPSARAEVTVKARKLQREAETVLKTSDNGYHSRLEKVAEDARAIVDEILDYI